MNFTKQNPPLRRSANLLLLALLVVAVIWSISESATDDIVVRRLPPPEKGGRAVELVYTADVSIDIFWRFKTDFSAKFLLSNRYITSNRLVARQDTIVITETSYSYAPGVTFRWQTTLDPLNYLMNYVLLNPEECGQRFNYGSIKLMKSGRFTRVTHRSYFDFFGATLWDHFPGPGGMKPFLRYTAQWEIDTVRRLLPKYRNRQHQ